MKYWRIYLIIAVVAAILVFRVVIPFNNVFTSDGIRLNTADAYYQVRYADSFSDSATLLKQDYFLNYPDGVGSPSNLFYASMVGVISNATGFSTLGVAAVLPVLWFLLALIPIFIIGKMLFGEKVGYLAVGIIGLMPGTILDRTMLGAGDYHSFEILLLSLLMMLAILIVKSTDWSDRALYGISFLMTGTVYLVAWRGALISLFIIGLFLFILTMLKGNWTIRVTTLCLVGAGIAYVYVFQPFVWEYSIGLLTGLNINEHISEMQPMFFSNGQFDLVDFYQEYAIYFYVFMMGLGLLIYEWWKTKNKELLLFLVWTLVIFDITFMLRRFNYYFAINIGLVSAFTAYYFYKKFFSKKLVFTAGMLLITIVPFGQMSFSQGNTTANFMSEDWINVTQYLKQFGNEQAYLKGEKLDYGVLCWDDYRYWICEESHLPVYHSPLGTNVYKVVLAENLIKSGSVYEYYQKGIKYIVTDPKHELGTKYGVQLIYKSGDIKVFEVLN